MSALVKVCPRCEVAHTPGYTRCVCCRAELSQLMPAVVAEHCRCLIHPETREIVAPCCAHRTVSV